MKPFTKSWSAAWSWMAVCAMAIASAALLSVVGSPAVAQVAHETPPILSARHLLPPDMLAGALFRVDDRVPTDGYMAHFTLRSDLGTFAAPGWDLLKIRIEELAAIQQLEETSKSEVFLAGLANAAARPIESAVNIVTDPVGTVESLPTGLGRFFDRVELGTKSIVQAASDSSKSGGQRTQETAQRVGDVTITALGFEQVRRQLAKSLGVDPYTTNPVLSKKLTDVAWVAFSGRLGVDVLMAAAVPGSTFISLTSVTSDLVYDTPKADLIVLNQQKMIRMGATEAQAAALLKNRWYSLSVLTMLVTELERLAGVEGRAEIIALAATVQSEQEARFVATSVQLLARLNETGIPLRELAARGTVVGVTSSGDIVLPAPVDYVSWTEQIARLAARPDIRAPKQGIWLTGRMSARAQEGLSGLAWAIHDAPQPARTP